jgi:hypothetical protein
LSLDIIAANFTPEENFQMDICGAENKSGGKAPPDVSKKPTLTQ